MKNKVKEMEDEAEKLRKIQEEVEGELGGASHPRALRRLRCCVWTRLLLDGQIRARAFSRGANLRPCAHRGRR